MNAQEALHELFSFAIYDDDMEIAVNKYILKDLENDKDILQQLIDQANAKPKTLEELGWTLMLEDTVKLVFGKRYGRIAISKNIKSVNASGISYAELLAIAEKMKELGMPE